MEASEFKLKYGRWILKVGRRPKHYLSIGRWFLKVPEGLNGSIRKVKG